MYLLYLLGLGLVRVPLISCTSEGHRVLQLLWFPCFDIQSRVYTHPLVLFRQQLDPRAGLLSFTAHPGRIRSIHPLGRSHAALAFALSPCFLVSFSFCRCGPTRTQQPWPPQPRPRPQPSPPAPDLRSINQPEPGHLPAHSVCTGEAGGSGSQGAVRHLPARRACRQRALAGVVTRDAILDDSPGRGPLRLQ